MGVTPLVIAGVTYAWSSAIALMFTIWSFVYTIGTAIAGQDEPTAPTFQDPGIKTNSRSTKEPLKVLYGSLKIGGNDVYMGTTGDSDNILWVVQTLSEGECDSIVEDEDSVAQIFLGDKLISEYSSYAGSTFYSGSATQEADADLVAATASLGIADDRWTDPQRYTCYILYKFTWSRDYFQGLPQRTVELKGRKVYDFRDGSTAYSTNPALCLYDYITNTRYGRGKNASTIDITSWTSAADYCDANDWTLNILINQDKAARDIVNEILRTFRGTLVWWDGKFYLRYSDLGEESTAMALEDKHIVRDTGGKAVASLSQPSKFGIHDGLRVTYADAEKNFNPDSIVIGEESGNIGNVALNGITDRETAGKIGTYLLEREQLSRSVSGLFRDDAVQLEAHDVVTFKSEALSIPQTYMRVIDANIQQGGLIELNLSYEATALYNDVFDIDLDDIYDSTLPDPSDPPPGVSNGAITEENYNFRLRTFTRLLITFDPPTEYAWFDHVEVHIMIDAGAADYNAGTAYVVGDRIVYNSVVYDCIQDGTGKTPDTETDYWSDTWEHAFNATTDFNIDPVEDGARYYIRLKTVSIHGVKQSDENAYSMEHLVGGQTSAPSSLTALYAIVNSNCINLYATKVDDPDVEVYEFRLGSSWSGAIFLAALRAPNLSLYGVNPGSHTFWCNTLSTNGEYGETPVSAAVSLLAPPDGWSQADSETDDYTGGTHDNTEHLTYSGDDYLKCSHSGSLTGTYLSPIFDLTSSTRFLVYISTDIVITGEGTTWDDVIPLVFEGSELVDNGGFESWPITGEWPGINSTATEEAVGFSGECVKVTPSAAHGRIYQNQAISGEIWYRADFHFSGEEAEFGVYDNTNSDWITPDGRQILPGASGWQDEDYLFKTPAGCSEVQIQLGSSGEAARFDSVSLFKVDEISSATWDDVDVSRTWTQIFELTAGASVQITLKYGDTSPPAYEVEKMELLSGIVTGRYFQVEIKIIDPSDAINALVENFEVHFCELI